MAPPFERKSGYLPGLDGLRALAIFAVLMAHDLPWSIHGHSNSKWKGYGGWGVQLFFAISGVLICWRLLEDEARSGRIQLGAFYTRRLFRIQPAALCYLAVVALLFFAGIFPPDWRYWLSAVFSYTNFMSSENTSLSGVYFLGHFWTLAVEEHFYILISLLLFCVKRHRPLLLALALAALLAGQSYALSKGDFSPDLSPRRTYWVVQFLLFPALLALLLRVRPIRDFAVMYLRPWVVTLCVLVAILIAIASASSALLVHQVLHPSPFFLLTFRPSLIFYGCALWVVAIMLHPSSWTTRVLELRLLRFAGRLSYSIYLWHVLFFIPVLVPGLVHAPWLLSLGGRPWKYLATASMATLSYYAVERPLIRLGHRVAPPATAGHRDLAAEAADAERPMGHTRRLSRASH